MMKKTENRLEVPEKGTKYWYVRSTFGKQHFDVCECEWIGGISDKFRYCRGNFYLDKRTAESVCDAYNGLMARL